MDVVESVDDMMYLTVHRKKTVAFLCIHRTTSVGELKRILEGCTRIPSPNMKIFSHTRVSMEDSKLLSDYGYNVDDAKAHGPMVVYLTVRNDFNNFEDIEAADLTSPPELPNVMRPNGDNDHQSGLSVPN